MDFTFRKIANNDAAISQLKKAWQNSLSAPQDGMWEAFMDQSAHWVFEINGQKIGYACVDEEHQLLQFYVLPKWLDNATTVFQGFIVQEKIMVGMIGTNNPIYLSNALHFQKTITIDTYLFNDLLAVNYPEKEGDLTIVQSDECEILAVFGHESTGAPIEWLMSYFGDLINKGELFVLRKEEEIIGTCEVRVSNSNPEIADIGMIVLPKFRQQGYGTYLLGRAKEIAKQRGKAPICSCEKGNIGSLKSIHKNGFRSIHQILKVEF